jgi:SAM-dependent methyltransferase
MLSDAMEFTGERMVPEGAGACTFWEHVERYRFARGWVAGKRVLDIASGEGYGSCALLRAGAKSVIGVDIDPEACAHAMRKYGIEARTGSGEAIPLDDGSVDVVVSFETIEHISNPGKFLEEIRRVLVPGGTLVISTPDKEQYNSLASDPNPFHCSEMSEKQFREQMEAHFVGVTYYGQGPNSSRWWSPESLVSRNSPWDKVKGLGRVKRKIWRWSSGRRWDYAPESDRLDPVQAILVDKRSWLLRKLDWFSVRRFSQGAGWRPVYWIAVAQKVSTGPGMALREGRSS